MSPNLKFLVLLVISIFAALGIGIYFGSTLDAQDILIKQKEDIVSEIEERFDYLTNENKELKTNLEIMTDLNRDYEYFIQSTYKEIIRNRLMGLNVVIIETNNDYMYSGTGHVLDIAGANLTSLITITDKFMDEQMLLNLYEKLELDILEGNIIEETIRYITESLVVGNYTEFFSELNNNGLIEIVGLINEPVDYVILAGGGLEEDDDKIDMVDETIVEVLREYNVNVIGVEKINALYSYIDKYKALNISTVDNVDTSIGKVSLILAMEGRPGHYGMKETAEEIVPNIENTIDQYYEEMQENE